MKIPPVSEGGGNCVVPIIWLGKTLKPDGNGVYTATPPEPKQGHWTGYYIEVFFPSGTEVKSKFQFHDTRLCMAQHASLQGLFRVRLARGTWSRNQAGQRRTICGDLNYSTVPVARGKNRFLYLNRNTVVLFSHRTTTVTCSRNSDAHEMSFDHSDVKSFSKRTKNERRLPPSGGNLSEIKTSRIFRVFILKLDLLNSHFSRQHAHTLQQK